MRPPALLALTPGDLSSADDPRLFAALRSALGAGLAGVLIREPQLEDRGWLRFARALRALAADCVPAGEFWLGVHDRVHLAAAVEADAVHLGFRSLAPDVVRERFGAALTIGLSTHADDDRSTWAAADYLFHGPVFETPSKSAGSPGWRAPVGLAGLAAVARSTEHPVWALGGISPERTAAVLETGAAGVAVLSGILRASEPAAAVAGYLSALPSRR